MRAFQLHVCFLSPVEMWVCFFKHIILKGKENNIFVFGSVDAVLLQKIRNGNVTNIQQYVYQSVFLPDKGRGCDTLDSAPGPTSPPKPIDRCVHTGNTPPRSAEEPDTTRKTHRSGS